MSFFFFFLFLDTWLAGSYQQFPKKGSNPCPLQWKCRVLTTGPPGKAQFESFKIIPSQSHLKTSPSVILDVSAHLCCGQPEGRPGGSVTTCNKSGQAAEGQQQWQQKAAGKARQATALPAGHQPSHRLWLWLLSLNSAKIHFRTKEEIHVYKAWNYTQSDPGRPVFLEAPLSVPSSSGRHSGVSELWFPRYWKLPAG